METVEKESLIGREIKCLDKGFVRLVDYMGSDAAIVQAARVSYGVGTKTVNEDRGLIRYLLRHAHTSPVEMVEFKFHIKVPIFIARQWIRHRTASVNEYSGRYSEMRDEFYIPDLEQIRPQSTMNKQGRSDEALPTEKAQQIADNLETSQKELYAEYRGMLEDDVARELARINLPLSMYTEWYWKIDLHNLFHFLRLRLDDHAQYEIRVYGEAIAEIVKEVVPHAWEAFEDYILHSAKFSRPELLALKSLLKDERPSMEDLAAVGLKTREAREFLEKLDSL
ncbi:MAG: FAD-dependent thymidylate synthase [Bacteroidota bacterium]